MHTGEAIDYRSYVMKALVACGGGMGMTLAWFAIKLVTVDPKLAADVVKTVLGWGPLSLIAIVGVVQADIRAKENLRIQAESARAQQSLADAVRESLNRDDREGEEAKRLMSYLGTQQEKILSKLEDLLDEKEPGKAKGATA